MPKDHRSGIALCLSGGGFRAALFHLGALRRLNELGVLSKVNAISSVSGGSIIAAHLAQRIREWPPPGEIVQAWEQRISEPFRTFTKRNLRTGPLLKRFLPWNWAKTSTAVEDLAKHYNEQLICLRLGELPEHPRFIFCATDMTFGVNWVFEKSQVGDYQAGYLSPPPDWPVGRAVAASSCFPPVFDPLPVGLQPNKLSRGAVPPGRQRDALIKSLSLTDGGVYDNMGLEPVWKNFEVVLVSDGGATFDFESDKNPISRLLRYPTIVENQSSSLRKRWLISNFILKEMQGTYWGIGSATEKYDLQTPKGYSELLVEEIISKVRTDLDAFSDAECKVLENHGYLLAEVAIQRYVSTLAHLNVPLHIPHPEWMNENLVRQELANSHKRSLLGRKGSLRL